jgi:cation transport regulator ChaB
MSALLSLNSNALPEDIKVNVQNIFQQIIRELVFIEEQKIKDDNAEEGDGSDGDDDGTYMHLNICM